MCNLFLSLTLICRVFSDMLDSWKIDKARVHMIIRDNAANMVKAMVDGGYSQLIVHDSVLSQRAVVDTLAVCRKIVGHFKHSPLASSRYSKKSVLTTTLFKTRCTNQMEQYAVHVAMNTGAKDGTWCLLYTVRNSPANSKSVSFN